MIARLTGRCVHADSESIIIDVNGVGYLVRSTASVLRDARKDREISVHIHTSVREDAIQLYGFSNAIEQRVFEQLVQVQGVGPKVAIGVLSVLSPREIRRATDTADKALLQTVPGVGPKVATRIVTELKGKLNEIVIGSTTFTAEVNDAVASDGDTYYEAREALIGLGMTLTEAEQALQATDPGATTEERIKQALTARAPS